MLLSFLSPFSDLKRLVYGCVLRIHRPKECRSFFVDPVFSKRFDAKTAVCLLAISRGVEDYFSSVANEVANIIAPDLRAFASEQIIPLLNQMAPGDSRHYSYPMDRNGFQFQFCVNQQLLIYLTLAFGCTLTVGVGPDEIEYSTEPEFSSKADAKIALLLVAATYGLIEFINYGHTPQDFRARWVAVEAQVSSMPITFTTPIRRKRDRVEPQPIPVMKESKKSKKKRKQTQATAVKNGETAALLIKEATSRTSHSSSGMPGENSLTTISMPSIGGSRPLASSTYLPPVHAPHLQQAGTWPTSLRDTSRLNSNSMCLQTYSQYSHRPTQNQYERFAGHMDPSSQQIKYGYCDAGPR